MKKICTVSSIVLLFLVIIPARSQAQSASNDIYGIQSSTVTFGTPLENPKETVDKSLPESSALQNDQSLTLSLDQTLLTYDMLTPTDPVLRKVLLNIHADDAWQLRAGENNMLTDEANFIPDTSCDGGKCTPNQASIWNSPLTYGFGINCENIAGNACAADFLNANSYRPLANEKNNDQPTILMGNSENQHQNQASIGFKVNVSGTQPKAIYQNTAQFILIPNL